MLPLLFFTLAAGAQGRRDPGDIAANLVKRGYENVRAMVRNDTLFISAENRVWRWEPSAVAAIFTAVMPEIDSGGAVSLTLLRTGIPVTTVTVSRKNYDALLAGTLTPEAFTDSVSSVLSDRNYRSAMRPMRPANRPFGKVDVAIGPQLKLQFGEYDEPLQAQFNIVPTVSVAITRGLSFTGQVIFPVYNNLPDDPEGNAIRPGVVALSQDFRLPYGIFTSLNAGLFTRDRYGLEGEAFKLFFNGRLSAGGSLGYTGQLRLIDGTFTYSSMDDFTWSFSASWLFARQDLTLRAGYGRFIDGDQGWRADVSRRFGEISIGFFAMQTDGLLNGGFNFIVPLPPRKYGTKNYIRLRPSSCVPWEYRAKGLPAYGRSFETGSGIPELLFDLNPDYIRNHLGKQILTGK